MIARLQVHFPFGVIVPDDLNVPPLEYLYAGYRVRVLAPTNTDLVEIQNGEFDIAVDGRPGHRAHTFVFEFHAPDFDRISRGPGFCDPPFSTLGVVVNDLLTRLRWVRNASMIHSISAEQLVWRLRYLNDDGSELEFNPDLLRGRGGFPFKIIHIPINEGVWEDIRGLGEFAKIPEYQTLLLDAIDLLPQVGASIVLAQTGLEVFIGSLLDEEAETRTTPMGLWEYMSDRRDSRQNPSVDDQFDILLRTLVGRSLKDELQLWESFKNLKTARNTFVHGGVALIGGEPVNAARATVLIQGAVEIVKQVRDWSVAASRVPRFARVVTVGANTVQRMPGTGVQIDEAPAMGQGGDAVPAPAVGAPAPGQPGDGNG